MDPPFPPSRPQPGQMAVEQIDICAKAPAIGVSTEAVGSFIEVQ